MSTNRIKESNYPRKVYRWYLELIEEYRLFKRVRPSVNEMLVQSDFEGKMKEMVFRLDTERKRLRLLKDKIKSVGPQLNGEDIEPKLEEIQQDFNQYQSMMIAIYRRSNSRKIVGVLERPYYIVRRWVLKKVYKVNRHHFGARISYLLDDYKKSRRRHTKW